MASRIQEIDEQIDTLYAERSKLFRAAAEEGLASPEYQVLKDEYFKLIEAIKGWSYESSATYVVQSFSCPTSNLSYYLRAHNTPPTVLEALEKDIVPLQKDLEDKLKKFSKSYGLSTCDLECSFKGEDIFEFLEHDNDVNMKKG